MKATIENKIKALAESLSIVVGESKEAVKKINDSNTLEHVGSFSLSHLEDKMALNAVIDFSEDSIEALKDGGDVGKMAGYYCELYMAECVSAPGSHRAIFENSVRRTALKKMFQIFKQYLPEEYKSAIRLLGLNFRV